MYSLLSICDRIINSYFLFKSLDDNVTVNRLTLGFLLVSQFLPVLLVVQLQVYDPLSSLIQVPPI